MRLESVNRSNRGLGMSVGIIDANETKQITNEDHVIVAGTCGHDGLYARDIAKRTVTKGCDCHAMGLDVCMNVVKRWVMCILDKEHHSRFSSAVQPQFRDLLL